MIIHYSEQITDSEVRLTGDEARHCIKALRARVGDTIHVTDGAGQLLHCEITDMAKEECIAQIKETEKIAPRSYELAVAVCPTKHASRIEWAVEKMVEIGVHHIIILQTARTERSNYKPRRLDKIALSAMKQSKNLYLPKMDYDVSWQELINMDLADHNYIAHCADVESYLGRMINKNGRYLIAIGPEGDFTGEEVQLALDHDWKEVNLGISRLRTETAAVVAASCVAQVHYG